MTDIIQLAVKTLYRIPPSHGIAVALSGGADSVALAAAMAKVNKLNDMGLSVRAYNCLKAADIDTFADLVSYSRAELMKFRNFGRKSLNEIDLLVEKMKLSFGMDVTKYNIEPKKKNV